MKNILSLFAIYMLMTSATQACQPEAQFIGKVSKVVSSKSKKVCLIQINFDPNNYNSSGACPLDLEDIQGRYIKSSKCNLKVNDSISGILVDDGTKLFIEE